MSLHQKHYLRFFLITIMTLFYFLANIQRSGIPGAIFNDLQNAYNATSTQVVMLGAIFCWVYALEQLVVGLMVDKIGGFRVALIGSILFAAGAVIFPISNSLSWLYISRALVGFGSATFYLSTIREVKKFAKDKNFSLAVSYILFIGYSGGIIANAPFVACANHIGWKNALWLIGLFTLFLAVLYIVCLFIFKPVHIETETKFSLEPFREVLSNKKNINIYIFGAINYGLYYVVQSVIGKKFLEDFCFIAIHKSALILSFMALISACAGTIVAFISRCINNKRAVIFKAVALLSCFCTFCTSLFLIFNIHTKFIVLLFCISSFIGSISPILILTLHIINRYEVSAVAVSIQNFGFFMMVGILGMLSGVLMNMYQPVLKNGVLVYSNNSYLLVFALFFLLSLIQAVCAFKIRD